MGETIVDRDQIRGLVKERNEYKRLLDQCIYVLNVQQNKKIEGMPFTTTNGLASEIYAAFNRFER